MAVDGARHALAGKVVFRVPSSGLVYMANEQRQGAQFPPLILVTRDVDAYLVVMEGHVRLTAYLIAPEYIPSELEVIIGYCEHLTDWAATEISPPHVPSSMLLEKRSLDLSSTWGADEKKRCVDFMCV